jgi:NADPH-dependent ferric siderophore reductase
LLVFGDETALPAVAQLIEDAPESLSLMITVEIISEDARIELPDSPRADVTWLTTRPRGTPGVELVEQARAIAELPDGTAVFAAGEASAMQSIRKHLFNELGIDRKRATIRGYWKPAR